MTRKKRLKHSNSLLSDSWLVLAIIVAIVLITVALIWKILIITLGMLIAAVYIIRHQLRLKRLRATGIDQIDRMDGEAFEKRLWLLFQDLGYSVQATPYRGDWGADLVISKDGVRTVVQAKRYSKPVGLQAIQEAVTARAKYNCSHSLVVTNSTFTAQARELAYHNQTELWDREKLLKELTKDTQKNKQITDGDSDIQSLY